MKNVAQVLQQKQTEIERVKQEIQALHSVIPLLVEEADWVENGFLSPPRFRRAERKSSEARMFPRPSRA